jgi:hypothetical protein
MIAALGNLAITAAAFLLTTLAIGAAHRTRYGR